ncbi:Zn-dependent hydrolase, partial [Klebsiella pneumoniae]
MSHYLQINGQRLIDSLYALGEHGALPGGGVCHPTQNNPKKKQRGFVLPPPKRIWTSGFSSF